MDEGERSGGGMGLAWFGVLVGMVAVLGGLVLGPVVGQLSADATARSQAQAQVEQARSEAVMSQAQAQALQRTELERERTERERISSEARARAAELRAEQWAAAAPVVALVVLGVVVAVIGWGAVVVRERVREREARRLVMVLEAAARVGGRLGPGAADALRLLEQVRRDVEVSR